MRALFLSLAVICWQFSAVALVAVAAEDKPSTKVEGTFVIPKEVPSFEGRLVEIRLYKHDPRIADKAADLVERVEIKDFSHAQGKETKKDFAIGANGTLEPKMGYYVTLFILQKEQRTHIGECEHSKKDLCKVLTNGEPSKISLKVREVKK
jgi:hypothetical protein